MAIDLSALSTRQALTAIYIGYYDRAADPAGIQFWEGVVANTSLDLVAITSDFAGQAETQAVHPFFADPATSSPATFITSLYQNLFNRDPDAEGLAFWSAALQDAIDGVEGAISVGQIITSIIEGAVDDPVAGTFDRTTILNKIEVGLDWTEAAEAANVDFANDAAAQASAKSIIEGVTDEAETVASAKATTDAFFEPEPVTGDTFLLTSATDAGPDFTGGADNDEFLAYIQQNPFAGGVSNSLSSADRIDGGAGTDRLYAELSYEFVGTDILGGAAIDLQPRVSNIEEIDIEARDTLAFGGPGFGGSLGLGAVAPITVDAKNITDHVEIGSYYSDGDLVIENVTTLTSSGTVRNTSDLTVVMDHTDNFNSDNDASDLTVYFDNDYLVAGQTSVGRADFFLLDQDAELRLQLGQAAEGRLDEIDKNGIRFEINDQIVAVEFDGALLNENAADEINDHDAFIAALQAPLQALIDAGTLPAGTQIVRFDYTQVIFDDDNLPLNQAALQDGSFSDLIPSIQVISGDGSEVTPLGFTAPDEITGEFNVFGRFDQFFQRDDEPIAIDVELNKAGRGADGGNLIIGGKSQDGTNDGIAGGIEVFNIDVTGGGLTENGTNDGTAKPSNLGTITSTGNALGIVNIATDPDFASNPAELIVRNGFDQDLFDNEETGDLMRIDANDFLGNLTLGVGSGRITNADTITATGGGDVALQLLYDGEEFGSTGLAGVPEAYSVTTGSGSDTVDIVLDGDAIDYQDSSLSVETGGGDDSVEINFDLSTFDNQFLNGEILDNVMVSTGSGSDVIDIDDLGSANIMAGSGADIVYTDGGAFSSKEIWALNYDDVRSPDQASLDDNPPEDLPGEALSLAYLDNATITVTLSGAGVGDYAAGGGVMSQGEAIDGDNGYESTVTITSLINGNQYFGDQRDINAAITRAIEEDPVLDALLTVIPGANNTIAIVSKTSGEFDASDLRIDIQQETYTSDSYAGNVASEAQAIFANSAITVSELFAGTAAGSAYDGHDDGYGADLTDDTAIDVWYDGLSIDGGLNNLADNTHTDGSASTVETDNVINGEEGNDIIVLSTDAEGDALPITPTDFTKSPANSLINGASNETIVLTGSDFGNDTVMNFTANEAEAGLDFLDFTAYLTSQLDFSTGTPGSGSDSFRDIDTTLDTDLSDVEANEVAIVTFTAGGGDSFGGLSASVLAAAFNNDDGSGDYGSIDDSTTDAIFGASDTDVVNGVGKAIVMVENSANLGDYKVFELTWNADAATQDDVTVQVTDLGELDFGTTLDNGDATFLVGSAEYDAIFA